MTRIPANKDELIIKTINLPILPPDDGDDLQDKEKTIKKTEDTFRDQCEDNGNCRAAPSLIISLHGASAVIRTPVSSKSVTGTKNTVAFQITLILYNFN
jgi:hypothetical protein